MTFSPKVWGDALRRLQNDIPDFVFEAWIAPLQVKLAENRIVLGCPSSFHCDRVRMHHAEAIRQSVQDLTGNRPQLEIVTLSEFSAAQGRTYETLSAHVAHPSSEAAGQEEALRAELRKPLRVVSGEQVQALAGGGAGSARTLPPAPSFTASPSTFSSSASSSSSSSASTPSSQPSSTPSAHATPDPSAPESAERELYSVPGKARRVAVRPPAARESGKHGAEVAGAHSRPAHSAPRIRENDLALSLDGTPAQGELPFSFESFVVGPCNSLAREAALALARQRQRSLNQIYLGGEAGMGKTHLARATAIEARRHTNLNPSFSARGPGSGSTQSSPNRPGIVYTTAEQFTSEFVSAMRHGRSDEFKKRYRGPIGLLIVEDVQSFQGRAKTQLELFNTIEHVLDAGGRVMLTGDRSPRDLGALDPRMREQLGRGFVAELEAPDALVRRHLLRAKAAAGGVHLPDDCLDLLVESTEGSVRDIESVLIQVVATSSLLGRSIDLNLTQDAVALKSGASSTLAPKTIAVSEIVRIVAAFFGKRPEALASRSRRRDVLIPRQLAMYLSHRYTDSSFTEIGKGLGRDHPAVRNAIQRIERLVLENAPLRYQIEALSERIDQTLKNQAADSTR